MLFFLNKIGKTAYDIAREFADPRVYLAVKTKFDALPKPKDGKKAKKTKKPEKKRNLKKMVKSKYIKMIFYHQSQ